MPPKLQGKPPGDAETPDHRNGRFVGYELVGGVYRPSSIHRKKGAYSRSLNLRLVRWQGEHMQLTGRWIRWATPEGVILPSPWEANAASQQRADEMARLVEQERHLREQERHLREQERHLREQERHLREQERHLREQERQRAERLAARLRSLGIDPDE